MNWKLNKILNRTLYYFSSLKLTVTCLISYFIIVFVGTLSQVDLGIYYTQKLYFQSFFIWTSFFGINIPIFPGGGLIGFLLLINLVVATIVKLQWKMKNIGLLFTHFGLIFLLLGAGLSSCITTESVMSIKEGSTAYFSEDRRHLELAIIDSSNPKFDHIVSIPDSLFKSKNLISHPDLPFDIKINSFYPNSQLFFIENGINPMISNGIGKELSIKPLDVFVRDDKRDNTSLILEFFTKDTSLGTWLASLDLNGIQEIDILSKKYNFILRPKRYYNNYSITLNDFIHDVYPGTNIPKDFASQITLNDFQNFEKRDVRIYMNHPLRYKGKTFFQMSFAENDTISIFQVVDNPLWQIPYYSCLLISLGLLIHFCIHLARFSKRI